MGEGGEWDEGGGVMGARGEAGTTGGLTNTELLRAQRHTGRPHSR